MSLLRFGGFTFRVFGLAPHLIARYDEWRWAETERLSGEHALQFLGRGPGEMTLEATLFSQHLSGHKQLHVDQLRSVGDSGTPYPMISGDYKALGWYALTSLESEHTYLDLRGRPRKDGLLIGFRRFGRDGPGGL